MASGAQSGTSNELRISDLQGAVQKESPDVYVTFRWGNEHVETPVRGSSAECSRVRTVPSYFHGHQRCNMLSLVHQTVKLQYTM
jgi:hypothetical protein